MKSIADILSAPLRERHRLISALLVTLMCAYFSPAGIAKPNLLLIIVDDMNADSVGAFGAVVPGTTPNIDQLASQGIRFEKAHVQVANCTPSRNVMWSGRYPHSNKVEGFYQVANPGYLTLSDLMQEAGYFTAIRHKVPGSTPYSPYPWDLVLDSLPTGDLLHRKDPISFGVSTARGIEAAKLAGKPFSLLINVSDPHLPFYGLNRRGEPVEDPFVPSRIFTPDEVYVPPYLVDDPIVRQELAHYYSTVRRADDAVGEILAALQASGEADNTLVMFLSDHGMPFPFVKTQLYHHSTLTPLIFRWPGIVQENTVDDVHMVSAIDILPTLLDSVGAQIPKGIQGRSLLPLMRGESQDGWDRIFKEYAENSSGERTPMRAIETKRFLYIFNPWSNGKRRMTSATMHMNTYKRMVELAEKDEKIASRLELLTYRVVEELYDVQADPDCLVNLIADPKYQKELTDLRFLMATWMRETQDPALNAFNSRAEPKALAEFMTTQNLGAQRRREWKHAIRDSLRKANTEKIDAPERAEPVPTQP